MKVRLLDYFRSFLLHTPPYTSTFLAVQEWEEPVLVMRVEELSCFQQGGVSCSHRLSDVAEQVRHLGGRRPFLS